MDTFSRHGIMAKAFRKTRDSSTVMGLPLDRGEHSRTVAKGMLAVAGADIDWIRTTVDRLERRFRGSGIKMILELMRIYDELLPRFQKDLRDERDGLLSRGGALMLIQGWSTRVSSES